MNRTGTGRLTFAVLCGCCLSGCQLSRTLFQIDSNSRIPFLGLQFSAVESNDTELNVVSDDLPAASVRNAFNGQPRAALAGFSGLMRAFGPRRLSLPRSDREKQVDATCPAEVLAHF